MNTKRIALSMIVKDEVESLDRCLASIAPYVDGIFVLQTAKSKKTDAVLKKYNAHTRYQDMMVTVTKQDIRFLQKFFGWDPTIEEDEKLFFFDKARNEALSMIPCEEYEYMMWLDADDIVRGGEKIPQALALMDQHQGTAMFMNYLYDVEVVDGQIKNILIEHLRERIIKHDGRYHWVAPIHETLIAKTGEVRQLETKDIDVVHISSTHEKKSIAIWRNIKNLEKDIADHKGTDPRPLYYLAKAFYDLHTPEAYTKAEKLIYQYLQGEHKSGWDEERAQAWEYLAEVYRERKEYNKAFKAALNALSESNKFPSTYLSLAVTTMYKQKWDEALLWLKLAGALPMPKTTLVTNPRDMIARTLEVIMNCKLKKNELDEAWAASTKLMELFPRDEQIMAFNKMLTDLREQRELTKAYVQLARYLELRDDPLKVKALIQATPQNIYNNPVVSDLVKRHTPPRTWGKKEVAIYCGPGWTIWNPMMLKDPQESFVGGSEEAVMYGAQELAQQGYQVTVYGDPGDEAEYYGVTYRHYFTFNPEDTFNILIGWRSIQFFERDYKARKTYLWLHDVPNPLDFTDERLKRITKIWCLSQAQRDCLPKVADEKFFITSNGIHEHHPKIASKPVMKRCIWTSSYDRGLQHLLDVWEEVKKKVPDAELRVFYGWQLFDRFYYNNPERQEWKARMEKRMRELGVYHGGRLAQPDLEKEYKKAGIWSYPTDFYEINCISALKAQAFGATPICTDHAALRESVRFGTKVPGDIWDDDVKKQYTQTLIKALTHPMLPEVRREMMKEIRELYSWKTVVTSWVKEFES